MQRGRAGKEKESVCEITFIFGEWEAWTSAKNKELGLNKKLENSEDLQSPLWGIGKSRKSGHAEGFWEPHSPELGNYKFVLKLYGVFFWQHLVAG